MNIVRDSLRLAVFGLCIANVHSDYTLGEAEVDFTAGKQCIAKLDLPGDYDYLKMPGDRSQGPLEMLMSMDIREVSEVNESKKSYTLDMVFVIQWKDERLAGQTNKTNCNPVIPHHASPEFWTPGIKRCLCYGRILVGNNKFFFQILS